MREGDMRKDDIFIEVKTDKIDIEPPSTIEGNNCQTGCQGSR